MRLQYTCEGCGKTHTMTSSNPIEHNPSWRERIRHSTLAVGLPPYWSVVPTSQGSQLLCGSCIRRYGMRG